MNTISTTAITINSVDYQERDKIITVISISGEKLALRARGINAPKAKLKFASELFSLCEFEHTNSKNPLLITATPKHMFWGVRESVEKLYLACFALEHISESAEDFKFLLACLSFLEVNEYSPKMAVKYILECVKHLGIGISFKTCVACGGKLTGAFAFDYDNGGFRCENCGGNEKSAILKTLSLVDDLDMQSLSKVNFTKSQSQDMLSLLSAHINARFNHQSENLKQIMEIGFVN
ncbi:MAG: DNA repair protein RecO [Bacillota bacterium]